MGKALAFLRLARIDHGLMTVLAALTGFLAVGKEWVDVTRLVCGLVAALMAEIGVFAFNDVFNLEEDRVNAPNRPLVRGDLTLFEAKVFGVIALALAVVLSCLTNLLCCVIIALAIATSMLYNVRLKREGFPGNLVVALNTALPFIYGAAIVERALSAKPFLYFLIAFFAMLGREVLKGIRDVEGDRRVGIKTLAIIWGPKRAAYVSALFMCLAVAITPLLLPLATSWLSYILLVAITDLLFLYSSIVIVREPEVAVAERCRKMTLLGMLCGILAFMAASV